MSSLAETPSILSTFSKGVQSITLNRPDKLNSFTPEMHALMRAELIKAGDTDAVRAVFITGNGKGFCAGQDLGDRDPRKPGPKADLGLTIENYYNPLIRLIRTMPKPIICAVNGVAAGAGANIALACDIVLAAKSAKFIQSFAKIGLVPDAGGSWTLPHILGEPRAKALALTATPLTAEQAEAWGAIWKAVDDETLQQEAIEMAESLAAGPTLGLGLTKMAIQAAAKNSFDEHLELEKQSQRTAGFSDDYAEGVQAFLEKRQPNFQGK